MDKSTETCHVLCGSIILERWIAYLIRVGNFEKRTNQRNNMVELSSFARGYRFFGFFIREVIMTSRDISRELWRQTLFLRCLTGNFCASWIKYNVALCYEWLGFLPYREIKSWVARSKVFCLPVSNLCISPQGALTYEIYIKITYFIDD